MAIDVSTGEVRLDYLDISLPGKMPLIWQRSYSSMNKSRISTMGNGWFSPYHLRLTKRSHAFEYSNGGGETLLFEATEEELSRGKVVRLLGSYSELWKERDGYVMQTWKPDVDDVQRFRFRRLLSSSDFVLVRWTDSADFGLDLDYDSKGRISRIRQDRERRALELRYSDRDRLESIALRAKEKGVREIARYEYDAFGNLIAAFDALGISDRFQYSNEGALQREILKDGAVFSYRYDKKNRCVFRSGLGRYDEKRLRFHEATKTTEVSNSYGDSYIYQYTNEGQVLLEVDPGGGQTRTYFDSERRIIEKTDPLGRTTKFEYDEFGNRNSVTNANNESLRFQFNRDHRATHMFDHQSNTWIRKFDHKNQIESICNANGELWQFRNDGNGNICEIVNPLQAVKKQSYADGSLSLITDWCGNELRLEYNDFGQVSKRILPNGSSIALRFDERGAIVGGVLPDESVFSLSRNAAGQIVEILTPAGSKVSFVCGSCGRLLERVDSEGVVKYAWGTEPGRLLTITNQSGAVLKREYDSCGRISQETDFDGRVTRFKYDLAGNVIQCKNGLGQITEIERDKLNRVAKKICSPGGVSEFLYDHFGHLVCAKNDFANVEFERDPTGRIVKESTAQGSICSQYDAVGNQTAIETSFGAKYRFEYDPNGYMTELSDIDGRVVEIELNEMGQEERRRVRGGVVLESKYDQLQRVVSQLLRGVVNPINRSQPLYVTENRSIRRYGYSKFSCIDRIEDGMHGNTTYSHSDTGRLLAIYEENGSRDEFKYRDDAPVIVERRIKSGDQEAAIGYGYSGNYLVSCVGDRNYKYDEAGRRIRSFRFANQQESDNQIFEWTADDRLVSLTLSNEEVVHYRYDALGRRIAKEIGGQSCEFIWDKDRVIHEKRPRSIHTWISSQFDFSHLATVQNGCTYTIFSDHLGIAREVCGPDGTLRLTRRIGAWGAGVSQSSAESDPSIEIPWMLPGQYHDLESGLSYSMFRYYDPGSFRFISPDILGVLTSLDPYEYGASPLDWIDPWGLAGEPCGFSSWGQFKQFGEATQGSLAQAGFPGTTAYMQGSAVTGVSHETGVPFDVGRTSDFDMALANESLFRKAESLGLTKGDRTGPIKMGSRRQRLLALTKPYRNSREWRVGEK